MIRTATCCCGRLSRGVEGEPVRHAVCHCSNCKKRTGSAFGISAYFNDQQIVGIRGDTHVYKIRTTTEQVRVFCKQCGTTLYWTTSAFPDKIGVAGGCFADHPLPAPTLTVSNENPCVWLARQGIWKTSIPASDVSSE